MKLKFIAILLLLIFAVSALSSVLEAVPDPSVGGNSSSNNKPTPDEGGNVTPEPEDPEIEILATWHDLGECVATCNSDSFECDSCHTVYTENEVMNLSYYYGDSFSYGYMNGYQCNCGGTVTVTSIHCFVNGACHLCGQKCSHEDSASLDKHYLEYLPENHPLRGASDNFAYEGKSYVENGMCVMCRLPFETESGDDNGSDDTTAVSWHNYGDCVSQHYTFESECSTCGSSASCETFSFGEYCYFSCGCPNDNQYTIHCFVDGKCHDCGYSCEHSPTSYEYYFGELPENHPLRDADSSIDSFIENGVCKLCGVTVE